MTKVSYSESLPDTPDFSLVQGGPLFQLFRRLHLSDDALQLLRKRIIVISLFAWLPLLLLSALDGKLLGARVAVPFLTDWEVHIRFLLALPLLIAAELIVHERLLPLVKQFLVRHLIPEDDMAQFSAAISSALNLRNAKIVEVLLIFFVYFFGIFFFWSHYMAIDRATWYSMPSAEGPKFTLAWIWYGYVSLPIFQFLLLRWYFRIFIWARFLWQVSRIHLNLIPTHPDHVGGLGFISYTIHAFIPLLLAHGVIISGMIASRIFNVGVTLTDFKVEILLFVLYIMALVFAPLLVFTPQLARVKRAGLREYGALAYCYVKEFDAKWMHGAAPKNEKLIGSADIQSLADMNNSFEIVRTMRLSLLTKETIFVVAIVSLAPVMILLLTMMPLEELLKKMIGILF